MDNLESAGASTDKEAQLSKSHHATLRKEWVEGDFDSTPINKRSEAIEALRLLATVELRAKHNRRECVFCVPNLYSNPSMESLAERQVPMQCNPSMGCPDIKRYDV